MNTPPPFNPDSVPSLLTIADAIGMTLDRMAHNCHAVSHGIVQHADDLGLGVCRVARGSCRGVDSQHSWVVVGTNPYDPEAWIVDATLWSYKPDQWRHRVYVGRGYYEYEDYEPHGWAGGLNIFAWGRPMEAAGDAVDLTPSFDLSPMARSFLDLLGPLDRTGWGQLVSTAPVSGWPSGEVTAAVDDTAALSSLVPIDRLGMLTDRNPDGLYLPADAPAGTFPSFTPTIGSGLS